VRYALGIALAVACADCDSPHSAPTTASSAATKSAAVAPSDSSPSANEGPAAASVTAPVNAATPETIIAQHVLVTYRGAKRATKTVTRTKLEARTRATEALSKLRAGAAFVDVVKAYSDDTSTIDRMGSLGKFRRDTMDPAFANAAFALAVGAVSDVVETPFGFHVIRRTQ